MDQQIRGVSLGIYPEIGEARIVYKSPPEYLTEGFNHLITLGKGNQPNTYYMTFWTWIKDRRFKIETKGTWYSREIIVTNRHLRAFKKIELGGLA